MALMMGNLYDALRAANVPDETAVKAAEEVPNYESRIAKIEADLVLLKWMVCAILALEIMQFAQMFLP